MIKINKTFKTLLEVIEFIMSINIHILETGSRLIELGYRVQQGKNKEIGKENIEEKYQLFK